MADGAASPKAPGEEPPQTSTSGWLDGVTDSVVNATESVARVVFPVKGQKEHQQALSEAVSAVGLLWNLEGKPEHEAAAPRYIPPGLQASTDVEVSYFGVPHRLVVLERGADQAESEDENLRKGPAQDIMAILHQVREWQPTAQVPVWPLHDADVAQALMFLETKGLASGAGFEEYPCWKKAVLKALRVLRITPPSAESMKNFDEQYGPGVQFLFAWSSFLVQQLWLLVLYVMVFEIIDVIAFGGDDPPWGYELATALGVVVWSGWLALASTRRFQTYRRGSVNGRVRRKDFVLASWKQTETGGERAKRWLMVLFVAAPAIMGVVLLVLFTCTGVTMLVLRTIFVWGECFEKGCRDATVTWAMVGWAAEVACDLLLAILFEVFVPLGKAAADWVVGLLNYKYHSDMLLFKSMVELAIAALDRIGFVGSLAFFFVPQWSRPECTTATQCPCNDFLLGQNDFRCYQRRLTLETRRHIFKSLMKGPFIVAPFISIVIKVIVPKLVGYIALASARTTRIRWCFWLAPFRCIIRFLTLIFTYDGGHVKCFRFLRRGQPFHVADDVKDRGKVLSILEQFKVKNFEVENELMELEMCCLWVVFFTPILPHGVIITTIAKLVEVGADLGKLLFVRRRPVPADDMPMRRELNTYTWCVVVAGIAWAVGLYFITYNDELYENTSSGIAIFVSMFVWMLAGAAVATWAVNRCSLSKPGGNSVRIAPETT